MWFYAESIGLEAALLRSHGGAEGKVLSVVRDGVYLQSLQGYVICLVGESALDGPLSVRVRDFEAMRLILEDEDKQDAWFGGETVVIGDNISLGWKHAAAWKGAVPRRFTTPGRRKKATDALDALLKQNPVPDGGLPGIRASLSDSMDEVANGVKTRNADNTGKVLSAMLGLGDGLTPFGDDLVMGALASMLWLAEVGVLDRRWVDRLVGRLRGVAGTATNSISERLLWYAGEGTIYAPAMELGAAMLAGQAAKTEEAARKLLQIGHTTGYGVANGIREVLANV